MVASLPAVAGPGTSPVRRMARPTCGHSIGVSTTGSRTGPRLRPARTTSTPADGTAHRVGGPASATRSSDAVRAVLLAAALVGGWLLFHELATLLVLLVIALVLALPLEASATRLERYRVPRPVGALLALVAIVGAVALVLALAIPPFITELQRFADELPQLVDQLRSQLGQAVGAEPGSTGRNLQSSLQKVLDNPQGLLGPIAQIGLGVAGAVATIVLVVMAAFYVAVNPQPLVAGVLRLFPPERRPWVEEGMADIRSAWIGWLYGVAVDMLVTGVLLYIGLTLVGLDFALVFAVLSALFVVVPYFGSVAGGIPPVLFALAEHGLTTALITLAVYIAVQQVEGNVIIPLVMSRAVKLHPAVVLVGVVLVGELLGFVGLIVAVPIISATMVVVRELWVRRVEGELPPPAAPARDPA
jgi:predicted PurR-regulated permease PerM